MNNGRAPRMTPEQKIAVFELCLQRIRDGERDPQQAWALARELRGIRLKFSSFNTGPWKEARAELKRRARPIEIPPPRITAKYQPRDVDFGPAGTGDEANRLLGKLEDLKPPTPRITLEAGAETSIRSGIGTFKSIPKNGLYEVEFTAKVDRDTHMNLMGTAYAILCPRE